MSQILDSGEKRQFDSGAVRDISEDKGRMDLLPIDIVVKFLSEDISNVNGLNSLPFGLNLMFRRMNRFLETRNTEELYAL